MHPPDEIVEEAQRKPRDPRPLLRRENLLFALMVVATLFASHWMSNLVVEKYRFYLPMQSAYGRMQVSIHDANRILSGMELKRVFTETQSIDDKGFSFYCLAVMQVTGMRLENSTMREITETILLSIHLLDLFVLFVLIVAIARVLGRSSAILFGVFYALFLPVPIYIYWSQAEYVLNAGVSLIVLAGFLLLPKHRFGLLACLVVLSLISVFSTLLRSSELLFPPVLCVLCFLKYGLRKGALILLAFLVPYLSILAIVTAKLDLPRHPIWHAIYVGLGHYPNPHGLQFTDPQGTEESLNVRNKDVNQWRPDEEYFKVMKGRSLSLISENPDFWVRVLMKRTAQVMFGRQLWEYYSIGFGAIGARVITGGIFVLSIIGVVLMFRERRQDAIFLLISQLYHSLIFVPIVPGKSQLYLASSIIQGVFAAYALSRLRFGGGAPPRISPPSWKIDPLRPTWAISALVTAVLVGVGFVVVFVLYARMESGKWNAEFLGRVEQWEVVDSVKSDAVDEDSRHRGVLGSVDRLNVGDAYIFHAVCDVRRGRVGFGVQDRNGESISPVAHNSSVGLSHVFVGFVASAPEAVDFHFWDANPTYLPLVDSADPNQLATRMELLRHYRVRDHAKREFHPGMRIEVTETSFPNGHEEIPIRIDKFLRTYGPGRVPAYWRSRLPATFRLELPKPVELSEIALLLHESIAAIEVKYGEALDGPMATPSPIGSERIESVDGVTIRQRFSPFVGQRITIGFRGEREAPVLVKDISLPDRTDFEVVDFRIHRIEKDRVHEGFPTRLSFRDP